jgi:hypothetical protein
MSTNEPNTDPDDVEQYANHVEHVTGLIADSLEGIDGVSEVQAGKGVLHIHMEPHTPVDAAVLEPLRAHSCFVTKIDVRDGGSTVERQHIRAVVKDDRLNSGWSQ